MAKEDLLNSFSKLVQEVGNHGDQCAILYLDEANGKVEYFGTSIGQIFLTRHQEVTTKFLSLHYGAEFLRVVNENRTETSHDETIHGREDGEPEVKKPRRSVNSSSWWTALSDEIIYPEEEHSYNQPVEAAGIRSTSKQRRSKRVKARCTGDRKLSSKTPTVRLKRLSSKELLGKYDNIFPVSMVKSSDLTRVKSGDATSRGRPKKKKKQMVGKSKTLGKSTLAKSTSKKDKAGMCKPATEDLRVEPIKKVEGSTNMRKSDDDDEDDLEDQDVNFDDSVTDENDKDWEETNEFKERDDDEDDIEDEIMMTESDSEWTTKRKPKKAKTEAKTKTCSVKQSGKDEAVEKTESDGGIKSVCLQCNKEYRGLSWLNRHLTASKHEQVCMEETDFKCFTCYKYFQREWDLTRHMKMTGHTGNNTPSGAESTRKILNVTAKKEDRKRKCLFRCSCCRRGFRNLETIQTHVKQAECIAKQNVKCPCCQKNFLNKNTQHVHIRLNHKDEYPFKCKHCSLVFYDIRNLKSHSRKHKNIPDETNDIGSNNEVSTDLAETWNSKESTQEGVVTRNKAESLQNVKKIQREIRGVTEESPLIIDEVDVEQECVVCSANFVNYNQLRVHIKATGHEQIVPGESGYKCFTCNKFFPKFVDLELHMELTSHTGNQDAYDVRKVLKIEARGVQKRPRNFRCSLCKTTFLELSGCEEHVRKNDCVGKSKKECPYCDMNFYKDNLFYAYMYQHHKYEFPFTCPRCEREFELLSIYMLHRKKDNCLKPLHPNSSNSTRHEAAEAVLDAPTEEIIDMGGTLDPTNYKCFSCDMHYMNLASLKEHMRETSHNGCPDRERDVRVETLSWCKKIRGKSYMLYRCTRCHLAMSSLSKAENHVASPTCTAYFKKTCPCCGLLSKSKNLYEAHMLEKHKDEYPFKCVECGKLFYHSAGLLAHCRYAHNKEGKETRPKDLPTYPCTLCSKQFAHINNLKQHIRQVHQKSLQEHICQYCGRKFSKGKVLKAHIIAKHESHNAPRFPCPDCGKVLKNKHCLNTHISTMHLKEQEMMCDQCGYQAHSLGMLNYHIRSHHAEGVAYRCEECGAGFKIKSHYFMHLSNHALSKGDVALARKYSPVYECEICHTHIAGKTKCELHMLKHLGDDAKRECRICGLRVMNATLGLRTHYRKKHKLKRPEIDDLIKDEMTVKEALDQLKKQFQGKEIPIPEVSIKYKTSEKKAKISEARPASGDGVYNATVEVEDSYSSYKEGGEGEEEVEYLDVSVAVETVESGNSFLARSQALPRDYAAEAERQISILLQRAQGSELILLQEVPSESVIVETSTSTGNL